MHVLFSFGTYCSILYISLKKIQADLVIWSISLIITSIVNPKIKIASLFTQAQFVLHLYLFSYFSAIQNEKS